MAACGVDLTVAVTEDGELLAWGHLGLGAVLTDLQVRRQRRHQTDAKGLSIWLLLWLIRGAGGGEIRGAEGFGGGTGPAQARRGTNRDVTLNPISKP
jgi:hypothetical protein